MINVINFTCVYNGRTGLAIKELHVSHNTIQTLNIMWVDDYMIGLDCSHVSPT